MKCKHCGEEIKIAFGRRKVFCSNECRIAFYDKDKEEKFCVICGKKLSGRQRAYCSDECRQKGKIAYQTKRNNEEYKKPKAEVEEKPKRKRGRPKKKPTIADINAKARAEGLNYGQYCAKHGLYGG